MLRSNAKDFVPEISDLTQRAIGMAKIAVSFIYLTFQYLIFRFSVFGFDMLYYFLNVRQCWVKHN